MFDFDSELASKYGASEEFPDEIAAQMPITQSYNGTISLLMRSKSICKL